MNFETLLQVLSRFIGIEEFTFDEECFCTLQLQDRFLLILRYDQEKERLVMAAEIETPSQLSIELLSSALAFNFQRMAASGAWVALDRETGTLFLADEILLPLMDEEKIQKRLGEFFEYYLIFQGIFSEKVLDAMLEQNQENTSTVSLNA